MKSLVSFVAGAVVAVLVMIGVWLAMVYGGLFNVAATDQHSDVMRWTMDTTMHRSVESRAEAVLLPDSFTDAQVAEGGAAYGEYCAHCHGGPGAPPAEWSRGMRPVPPHLAEAAAEWTPRQIYWIAQKGLKMTGMPAFGPDHSAEELTAITAFVSRLPGLTEEDYAALAGGGHGHGGEEAEGAEENHTEGEEPQSEAEETPESQE
jgi:mono/diheme cytochrome c family protein